jgi:hypothetical protein
MKAKTGSSAHPRERGNRWSTRLTWATHLALGVGIITAGCALR